MSKVYFILIATVLSACNHQPGLFAYDGDGTHGDDKARAASGAVIELATSGPSYVANTVVACKRGGGGCH